MGIFDNIKSIYKERKELKIKEKAAYKEEYSKARIKVARDNARLDAKHGGKFFRKLDEYKQKRAKEGLAGDKLFK